MKVVLNSFSAHIRQGQKFSGMVAENCGGEVVRHMKDIMSFHMCTSPIPHPPCTQAHTQKEIPAPSSQPRDPHSNIKVCTEVQVASVSSTDEVLSCRNIQY